METKENKENKKLIILIGILFAVIIGLLIALIFITNNSKKIPESDSSTTTTTTTTQIVEKNPYDLSKLNNEEIRFIDIEELNKYEYTMENNLFTKINNESSAYNSFVNNYTADFKFTYVPFLKISNKKLYWKVNNEWKEDNKIAEEIKFVTYFINEVTINKFVIITTNKIYIIYNHNEIYAILIIDKNNYYWSVCQDNILYPLEKKTKENKDYIIEMMLNFANEEKIKKIVPNISEMNTETKVKVLRSFHFNSTGYHFK